MFILLAGFLKRLLSLDLVQSDLQGIPFLINFVNGRNGFHREPFFLAITINQMASRFRGK
jgi:hypothetical protein